MNAVNYQHQPIAGHTLLCEYHERDLISVVDGRCMPVGRLPHDAVDLPPGTEVLRNYRRNKWWAQDSTGRIVLICLDP